MKLQFVRYRKIFYIFSICLVVLSFAAIWFFGLKWGIDFTGGSVLTVKYQDNPPASIDVQEKIVSLGIGAVEVQKSGTNDFIIKTKEITESQRQEILNSLKSLGSLQDGASSFESISPVVGNELQGRIKFVAVLSVLIILIYIALSFRKVSRPVPSYVYGFTGVVALLHDVMIPIGVFAVLGKYVGAEITIPFITAMLTVFGYSINDSVVVFDRIRENLLKSKGANFDVVVDQSLNQTLARSFNTSFTVLLCLFAVFFFGGESLRFFSLALIIGIGFGTYSSIFIATLLLSTFWKKQQKRYVK